MKRFFTLLMILFVTSFSAHANANIYLFNSEIDELRFQSLIRELRCPKCQNQNIADSDAPLAQDMKDITYDMIMDGRADSEIVSFMVDRYGDFVTYNPPVKPVTWVLWYGPVALLIFVAAIVFFVRRNASSRSEAPRLLSEEERAKLNQILEKES